MTQIPEVVGKLRGRLVGAGGIALTHLSPAGQARLDQVPTCPVGKVLAELREELGPLWARADERHVAAKDVPKLRQLVESQAAHHAARSGEPRIVGSSP